MIKPEIKAKLASGEIKETKPGDEFYHWMVIVPTKQVLAFHESGGRTRYALVEEFQIAIAKETTPGKESWTFISQVKPQDPALHFSIITCKFEASGNEEKRNQKIATAIHLLLPWPKNLQKSKSATTTSPRWLGSPA